MVYLKLSQTAFLYCHGSKGKNYIGIDANEKYVKIAERRLREIDKEIKSGLFFSSTKKEENFQLELQVV